MLLRSSSTPVLLSLLPPSSYTEPLIDSTESEALVAPESAKSLSFSSSTSGGRSFTSSGTQSVVNPDVFSGEELGWDLDGEVVLWPRIRKVRSENDLQSLCRGPATSAQVAASSLLCNDKGNPSLQEKECHGSVRKAWSRPPQRRRGKSLSCIPSVCLSISGLDRQDFIPEEEADPQVTQLEDVVETESLEGDINIDMEHAGGFDSELTLLNHVTGKVLKVRDSEVGVQGTDVCVPRRAVSNLNVQEEAVFSGREEQTSTAERSLGRHVGEGLDGYFNRVEANGGDAVCKSRDSEKTNNRLLCIGGGCDEGGGGRSGGGRPSSTCTGGSGPGAEADFTELYYQKVLAENPGHPLLLRNYAEFLAEAKHDYAKAEEYYQRAILASPGDGDVLARYAEFICKVHRDYERAEGYFERAVQAAPDNSYVMAAYASFLWNSETEDEGASTAMPLPSLPSLVSAGPA